MFTKTVIKEQVVSKKYQNRQTLSRIAIFSKIYLNILLISSIETIQMNIMTKADQGIWSKLQEGLHQPTI